MSQWLRAISNLPGYPNLLSRTWYWVHFISPITPDPAFYSGLCRYYTHTQRERGGDINKNNKINLKAV